MPEFVPVNFLPARVNIEHREDGILVLRSPVKLEPYARCLGEYLEKWALERPEQIFLAQRDRDAWRTLSYHEAHLKVRSIASALLGRNLAPHRPLAILSENSIEHALIALACMHIGIPVAPISAAYSLMSRDFAKLRAVFALLEPGLVFVDDYERFTAALNAVKEFDFELVGVNATDEDHSAVDRAFSSISPDSIAKFLLTSGSTGEPKAVINTQRMLCSNQQAHAQCWPFLTEEPPVIVDWLPWNHTMAGNNNFGTALVHGGSYYIDDGRPTPALIERTVRNLREVSPTVYYNVPRGYEALLPFLEDDRELRRSFFARLKVMLYGGAALSPQLWERLNRLALSEMGARVYITAGYGSTETAPGMTIVHFATERTGGLGLPIPGAEVKMVPLDQLGKYELRVKGPNVTPGYWKRDDLTAVAFDNEGYYKMGDAARFVDASDPAKGIEFAGRIAEDFKLTTGTWVHVGALRVRAIAALAPVAQDVVIAGHDRSEVGFLIFPDANGCRSLCPGLSADVPLETLISDDRVRERVADGIRELQHDGLGSSLYATRAIILADAPSIDDGEITDKGYINQRAVLERRAELVEKMYSDSKAAR